MNESSWIERERRQEAETKLKESMVFCFGDIVVVEEDKLGVVVKSWTGSPARHEVYVRLYNDIKEYTEEEMQRYMVRHKYLSKEEKEYQYNAVNGL